MVKFNEVKKHYIFYFLLSFHVRYFEYGPGGVMAPKHSSLALYRFIIYVIGFKQQEK